MALTDDEVLELCSHSLQDDPWTADEVEEFMAVQSGEAWVVVCPE